MMNEFEDSCDSCHETRAFFRVPQHVFYSTDGTPIKSKTVTSLCIPCLHDWFEENVPKPASRVESTAPFLH